MSDCKQDRHVDVIQPSSNRHRKDTISSSTEYILLSEIGFGRENCHTIVTYLSWERHDEITTLSIEARRNLMRIVLLSVFWVCSTSAFPVLAQSTSWAERITFSGDYRVRHEGFYNQKTGTGADAPSRNLIRVRGRFGLTTDINSYVSLHLRVATGNPENPISNNETLDKFFKRPTLALDRGFIRLSYGTGTKTVSADMGKISNPIYTKSQIVWDNDIQPSGIVEKFTIRKPSAYRFDVQLMQYAVEEVAAGKDAWMFGGQIHLEWTLRKGVEIDLSAGSYRYFKANLIAKSPITDIVKGNRKDSSGNFLSEFNLVNLNGGFTLQTGLPAYPVRIFGDFVVNTGAKKDVTGKKEHTGLYTGIRVGNAGKPGEISIAVVFLKVRQDAVLSTFSFSDVPSDGRQGAILELGIPLLPKTTFCLTGIFTKPLNGPVKSTLIRTQTDLSVQF